jgi:3-phenylpropionate/trans-cinnamate dioxygenase ferredoxin subunit
LDRRDYMGFVGIIKKDDLNDGDLKMVVINDHQILIARVGDDYYVSDNLCPHMGGNLSMGELDGTVITCPRHHSQFDLVDGHVIRWTDWTGLKLIAGKIFKSPKNLKTYPVKIDGDMISANLE